MKALVYNVNPLGWATCQWLKRVWPGCVFTPLNGLALREIESPILPGDDWVRLRTRLAGICGTDLAIIQQKQLPNSILQGYSSMPMLLGHENVAEVIEVGPQVDRSWLGKRVCVEPTLGCQARGIEPMCPCCQAGQFGACECFGAAGQGRYQLPAGTSIGYNRRTGGSYGPEFVAHVSQLIAPPDDLADETLILTDCIACSLHGVLRADLSAAQRILVYGAGAIGLAAVASLRAVGYAGGIDIVGRHEHTRAVAQQLGANDWFRLPANNARHDIIAQRTNARLRHVRMGNVMLSGGYDVIFDCIGSRQSINDSLKWTRARGQLILLGTGHGGRIDLTPLWFSELRIIGAYGRQLESWQGRALTTYALVHEFMAQGKLKADSLLTHRYRLHEYREALQAATAKRQHRSIKVAFEFREE